MTVPDIDIDVDIDRIQRRLDAVWEIGRADDGGVTRLAYSDEETAAIEYVRGELDDAVDVRTDHIGNVFATREPDADRTLLLGSHLDSVFDGGRLDGALGVIVALEAIETAYKIGTPAVPPTLAVFRAEESSRFGQWAVGSRGALGQLTVEDLSAVDQSGVPLWQAMQSQGLTPTNFSEPTIDLDRTVGFLEVHIEQGRVLDDADEHLGIVDSIRGPVRHRITVEGDYDHSGATPMGLRRDAIAGAAEMVTAVERIASEAAAEGDVVGTVGEFAPARGAINKVCGEVTFSMDVRSNDRPFRDDVEASILDEIRSIAERRGLKADATLVDRSDPVELDADTTAFLADVAASLGFDHRRLPSGGGHDAMNLQHAGVPTGMLFVPSVDGISHSPDEETPEEAIREAAATFTRAILEGPPGATGDELS
jgi:hydantoinase/carbamoylase family amidase